MGNKREKRIVKLREIQAEIAGVLGSIEQLESERLDLYKAAETLEIELSELQQKEKKLLSKLS